MNRKDEFTEEEQQLIKDIQSGLSNKELMLKYQLDTQVKSNTEYIELIRSLVSKL
jgi:hypothetical protein